MDTNLILRWVGSSGWVFCCFALFLVASKLWKRKLTRFLRNLGWMPGHETTDEERVARDAMRDNLARLDELKRPPRGRGEWGKARLFGAWIAGVLMTLAFTAGLAIQDHNLIRSLERQLREVRSAETNTHTWFDIQIVQKVDATHYLVHVKGRQKREALFLCPDSAVDANWDEGMQLDSFTFEQRENCKSIHADRLGFYVHRNSDLSFIHYEKEYDR